MSQTIQYIADRVKSLRKQQNLTMEQLAKKSNLTYQYLWQIENASANVTIHKLESISSALGVELIQLMPGSNGDKDESTLLLAQKINSSGHKELVERILRLCLSLDSSRDLELIANLLESMNKIK